MFVENGPCASSITFMYEIGKNGEKIPILVEEGRELVKNEKKSHDNSYQ